MLICTIAAPAIAMPIQPIDGQQYRDHTWNVRSWNRISIGVSAYFFRVTSGGRDSTTPSFPKVVNCSRSGETSTRITVSVPPTTTG